MRTDAIRSLGLRVALVAAGCSPAVSGVSGEGGDGGAICQDSLLTCADKQTVNRCVVGQAPARMECAAPLLCAEGLGCVECLPVQRTTCVGNAVHACGADGKIGARTSTCPSGCQGGLCLGGGSCSASGVDLIYVVDKSNRLLRFNPRNNANSFELVGTLGCQPGPPLRGGGAATPLSMSVDRAGRAYVLYTSGEIFAVSTADASCQPTAYKSGQQGFQFFGMGFVSDSQGGEAETLFLGGGDSTMQSTPALGRVAAGAFSVSKLGTLALATYPELTGTGKGELYAYFPGPFQPRVHALDKANAATLKEWKLPSPASMVRSYAFAHWGGQFFIFLTTEDQGGKLTSQVLRFNPADGSSTPVVSSSPYQVVGAGVSTCAPLVLG